MDMSRVGRRWITSPALVGVIALLAALLVYEVVRANNPDSLTVRLLGAPTTAGLLATALVVAAHRHHGVRTSMPLLRYVARWVSPPERPLPAAGGRCWQVRLRNAGSAAAVVTDVAWTIVAVAAEEGSSRPVQSLGEFRRALGERGFSDARDYWIANYSPGMALAPDEERCYFECSEDVVLAFRELAAIVSFASILGAPFEKRVSLIPQQDASPVVLETRA